MLENINPVLIVIAVLALILLLNYGIVKSFAGKSNRKGKIISRALESSKSPWKQENDQLDELSRLVNLATGGADDQTDKDESGENGV